MKPIGILITDTHSDKDNLLEVEDVVKQAIDYSVKIKVRRIFHGGDAFTLRTGQTLSTLLSLKKILDYADEREVTVYAIPGNHDKTCLDDEESYMDVYSSHRAFTLYSKEKVVKINGVNVFFLPYFKTTYSERLKRLKKLPEFKSKEKKILISHGCVNGVKNNDGTVVTDSLKPEDFLGFDKVYFGHYHDQSQIGKNIKFVGSAKQKDFGENSEDKGFTILYDDATEKFVPTKFRKFIKIKIDSSDKEAIKNEMERVEKLSKEANIRFIFTGTRQDFNKINLSKFTDLGIDCKFESNEQTESLLKVEAGNFSSFDKKSLTKNFFDFCKVMSIDSDKRSVGLKFLKAV